MEGNMKRVLVVLVLAVVAAFTVWMLMQKEAVTVPLVKVATGEIEQIAANSRAGTIKSCRRSGLSFLRGGTVSKLLVKEGERVKAGQKLLQLHDETEQISLLQSRTELRAAQITQEQSCFAAALAGREWERSKKLEDKKLVSTEKLDRISTEFRLKSLSCDLAKNHVEQTRSELMRRQVLLDEMQLSAPFAGVIAEINGELGEFTTPSPPGVATPPAVDLIDDSCLYVQAPIDEVEAAHLKVGQAARITLDAFRGRTFSGRLSRISPYVSELEKQARTVEVDVTFDAVPEDALLLVGYSADVEIIIQKQENQLRIPTDTLLGGLYVLRFNPANSMLEKVEIEPGIANWNWTGINKGLKEGDLILQQLDTPGAMDGAKVEPE